MRASQPEDCDRVFAACVRARDLDGLLELYESDARYVCHNGTVVVGTEAIRPIIQTLTNVPTEIEVEIVSVIVVDAVALIYNDWKTRASGRDGRARESSGQAIEIVRRQPDGGWLFAIDDPFGRSRQSKRNTSGTPSA